MDTTTQALAELGSKIARMEELTRSHFGTESHPWYNVVEMAQAFEHVKTTHQRFLENLIAVVSGRDYQTEVDTLQLKIQILENR